MLKPSAWLRTICRTLMKFTKGFVLFCVAMECIWALFKHPTTKGHVTKEICTTIIYDWIFHLVWFQHELKELLQIFQSHNLLCMPSPSNRARLNYNAHLVVRHSPWQWPLTSKTDNGPKSRQTKSVLVVDWKVWRDAQPDYSGMLDYCHNPTSSFTNLIANYGKNFIWLFPVIFTPGYTLSHLKLHVNLY